jgi:chorismate synthase
LAGSSYGTLFKLHTFGESHGVSIGGVIDGCPAGFVIDFAKIQDELNRRKPGQSQYTTPRNEADEVEFLSGIFEGKTTGTPIGFQIRNKNQESKDYANLKDVYRPSHADFTFQQKFGIRDHRGGGRASARETASRVVAGALAQQILAAKGILFTAFVDQIGSITTTDQTIEGINKALVDASMVRCPFPSISAQMEKLVDEVRLEGDTIGGVVQIIITGVPVGLGEPVFDKLHAELGKAFLSINAVKAVSFGLGFDSVKLKGSQHNDAFSEGGKTITNNSGGIQGGISNGMPIQARIAFKPVASISKQQDTITTDNQKTTLIVEGRHDSCVVPRAVPIVEAMAAIVVLDFYLRQKATQF